MEIILSNDASEFIKKKSPEDPSLNISVVQVKSG